MIKINLISFSLLFLTLGFFLPGARCQSLTQQLSRGDKLNLNRDELFTERVQRISDTRKIFILTNQSSSLEKGDFFTILLNDNLASRAIAAKSKNGVVGIKILKIYSLKTWNKIRKGSTVQILKGDDQHLFNKQEKEEVASGNDGSPTIEDEDDLYNEEKLISDGLDLEENKNRIIKTDNILTASYGTMSGKNVSNEKESFSHWSLGWSYQLADNFWGEALYGYSSVGDFPNGQIDTTITNFTFRLKYTIKAPFYSYIKPYLGYQIISAESPDAGDATATTAAAAEIEALEEISKNRIVFGVTILKRLVPGWFAKVDIGNDNLNIGAGIEF